MSITRPKKLLVYLDQNFISEMAKPAHGGVRPDFRELYAVLHSGFWNEKLVVLRSNFHDIETSLAGVLADAIKARRSTLGHVDLVDEWGVRQSQFVASLHAFLRRHKPSPVICYDGLFRDDPDSRVGHLDINVNMDWMHADAKEKRKSQAAELDAIRQVVAKEAITYDRQFRLEMEASRADALRPYHLSPLTSAAEVVADDYRRFVASKSFSEVPIVWLYAALMARLLTAHSTRTIQEGDFTDIGAMATYLPYCDVYGADRFTAEVARSIKVPERFKGHLFDSRKDGVGRLIDHLNTALAGVPPVNVPTLSIFVVPDSSIKQQSFAFFRRIGTQAKWAENRVGKWIEVFAFDDGRMPTYELPFAPGVRAPFFGLQDVVVIKCATTDGAETFVEAARKECRSSRLIIMDTFQELPDDFLMKALSASSRGNSSYMGYRFYNSDRDGPNAS